MARIGIMGGTFDPIHNGHLLLGDQACQEYQLDQVWFMPSGHPPHKTDHPVTDVKDRCQMVKLAIRQNPRFFFSDFETRREGNTYTAQTLELLKQDYPEHHFYFIVGADSLYQIERWYHPERILGHVDLLAADREYEDSQRSMEEQIRYLTEKYGGWIGKLHCREVDIASEKIRKLVADGISVEELIPREVADYIRAHQLYER